MSATTQSTFRNQLLRELCAKLGRDVLVEDVKIDDRDDDVTFIAVRSEGCVYERNVYDGVVMYEVTEFTAEEVASLFA